MKIYTFDCEIVTPLFMDGYGQQPELRTASFKGMLRWWFRALYGGHLYSSGSESIFKDLHKMENLIFGSTENGGIFSMSIFHQNLATELNGEKGIRPSQNKFNHYGAYGLLATNKDDGRKYIKAGQKFTIRFVFKKGEEYIPYVVGALAAFNLWGGIGSRSTKGFGSISVRSNDFPLLFPDLSSVSGQKIAEVITGVKAELFSIYTIKSNKTDHIPDFSVIDDSYFSYRFISTPFNDPNSVQSDFARKLRKFRENPKEKGGTPNTFHSYDYQAVFGPDKTPHDTIFGLPHNFSSRSIKRSVSLEGSGKGRERRVSPLRLKVIKAGGKYYQILVLFEARFLPAGDMIKGASKLLNQPGFARAKVFMKGFN